jgi:hypothetical protein
VCAERAERALLPRPRGSEFLLVVTAEILPGEDSSSLENGSDAEVEMSILSLETPCDLLLVQNLG